MAQFGRALRSGRRGRGFESRHLDHNVETCRIDFSAGFYFNFDIMNNEHCEGVSMFEPYKKMQDLNRKAMNYITGIIQPGMNLSFIKKTCEEYLLENGADSFWYWNIGAFIFADTETIISISGNDYEVTDKDVQNDDIITIDLSPQSKNVWGDFARTIIIENGKVAREISDIKNKY